MIDLSISPLELLLKECYRTHPEIQDRILTSDELSAYITGLISAHREGQILSQSSHREKHFYRS